MMRITLAASLLGGLVLTQPAAAAERICKQDCVGSVCSKKCVESGGPKVRIERDRDVTVGRGGKEREVIIEERDRRRHREPGVGIRAPGVDVEIGR